VLFLPLGYLSHNTAVMVRHAKLQWNLAVIQARERQLQQQVISLQQVINDLRQDLSNANKDNEDLQKRRTEMVMSCDLSQAVHLSWLELV